MKKWRKEEKKEGREWGKKGKKSDLINGESNKNYTLFNHTLFNIPGKKERKEKKKTELWADYSEC